MKIDCIIGIDPGVSGGIAIYRIDKNVEVKKMPKDLFDLKEWFIYMNSICKPLIFLEKVNLRTDDLDDSGKIFRIQKLLNEFEKLKTIITLCDIPYILVNPMKWQSGLRLRMQGEEKKERKKRYVQVSSRLYPSIKTTLWNADAILIMHFGRHILQSDQRWVLDNLPRNMHNKLF